MSKWFAAALVVAAVLFAPFLLKDRDLVVSTPSPRPLFDVTFIPVHGRLCASDVTIPHDARELRYATRRGDVRRSFTAPARTRLGTVCLAAQADFVGTTEARTQSRPRNTLNGRPIPADAYLAFYAHRQGSALGRTPQIIHRAATFKPGIVGPWLLWPLLALVILGIPALLFTALRAGARRGRW